MCVLLICTRRKEGHVFTTSKSKVLYSSLLITQIGVCSGASTECIYADGNLNHLVMAKPLCSLHIFWGCAQACSHVTESTTFLKHWYRCSMYPLYMTDPPALRLPNNPGVIDSEQCAQLHRPYRRKPMPDGAEIRLLLGGCSGTVCLCRCFDHDAVTTCWLCLT